jgi:hypothetical protein
MHINIVSFWHGFQMAENGSSCVNINCCVFVRFKLKKK